MLIPFSRCLAASCATGLLGMALLSGCTASPQRPVEVHEPPPTGSAASDTQRIGELQRQLAERQRQCNEEKKRQDQSLKEAQKRNDELQKKLDTLLAIDRELRSRGKGS